MGRFRKIEKFANYQVDNAGVIQSDCIASEWRTLKPTRNAGGYLMHTLIDDDGRRVNCLVHRLVASAFLENPLNLPLVRHLNGKPDDNRLCNLAWGTVRENSADASRHGTLRGPGPSYVPENGPAHPMAKLSADEVEAAFIEREVTAAKMAARFGVSRGHISSIRRGHACRDFLRDRLGADEYDRLVVINGRSAWQDKRRRANG